MSDSDIRRALAKEMSETGWVKKRATIPTWRMAEMSRSEILRELGLILPPKEGDDRELTYPEMSTLLLLNLGITHVNPLACHLHRWMLAQVQARDGALCFRCQRLPAGGLALLRITRATLLGLDLKPVRGMCPECRARTNFEREKRALVAEDPPDLPEPEVEEVEVDDGTERVWGVAPGQQRDARGRLMVMASPRKISVRRRRKNGPRRRLAKDD